MPRIIEGITFYSVEDLQERLGLTAATIRKYIRQGTIKGKRIGRPYYVTEENLRRYLNGDSEAEKGIVQTR